MKKHIRDIYTPRVIGVAPGSSALHALGVMRENKTSCIIVLEAEKPVGIFTERDVVRCITRYGPTFTELPMAELMSREVRTVTRDAQLYEAFSVLTENKIRHLVVVDENTQAVGVVTLSNMVGHFGYDYFVKVKTVRQVMSGALVATSARASVFEAVQKMAGHCLSFLVVCKDGFPVGVLTERDIAALTSLGVDLESAFVEEHMSAPVQTLRQDQSAFAAVEMMRAKGIRRIVIVDAAGKALGVVTQSDMVKGLESGYVETLKQIIKEQGAELTKTVRQLAKKTLYLDSILSSSVNLGIVALDVDLKVSYFNTGAEKLLGISTRLVFGKDLRTLYDCAPLPCRQVEQGIALVRNNMQASFCFERKTKNELKYLQAQISGIRENQRLVGFVLLLEDITEKHKAEETIRRLAYYDVLTGLPNRVLFYERLASELARCRRHQGRFAVMLMDVDKFKDVNDTHGHHAGDILLRQIAERLHGLLRETDSISRLGGDEFCFILTDVGNAADAERIADKVVERLYAPYVVENLVLDMRFSFGIALYPEHGADSGTLVRLADKAMYRAKDRGRRNMRSNIECF